MGPRLAVQGAWNKWLQRRHRPGFHSRFGGLWTDRLDALGILEERRSAGELTDEQAVFLRSWIMEGYGILPGVVPRDTIERLNREVEELWQRGDARARIEIEGRTSALDPRLRAEHCKLVDLYAHSRTALELALARPIRAFLRLVFEREPLLFQSLSFERGSEQPVHQDTAYVPLDQPLELVAAWIALEDIQPGSGELVVYPGSHRLPDTLFRGGGRNWNRERDGLDAQRRYHERLLARLDARRFSARLHRPRQGDVLFWSADLAHGGSPIEYRGLTRRSLVCHYCPDDVQPYYFTYRPESRRRGWFEGCAYTSSHHDLESLRRCG